MPQAARVSVRRIAWRGAHECPAKQYAGPRHHPRAGEAAGWRPVREAGTTPPHELPTHNPTSAMSAAHTVPHTRILIGLVGGATLGCTANALVQNGALRADVVEHLITYVTRPVGDIFLNLLFM